MLSKYHGIGNDYLVCREADLPAPPNPAFIKLLCDRHYGVGSDGLLVLRDVKSEADFVLQIWNPDGSIAEKSGNGVRIFSRFLYDLKLVGESAFTISTDGGLVTSEVKDGGKEVSADMGIATFDSTKIPVIGDPREVVAESITMNGRDFTFTAASVGNPHCVLFCEDVSPELAKEFGPHFENHTALFPNRTNVQFLKIIDEHTIQIEIWERGAGYTLSSGSSSCAAAAAAVKSGRVKSPLTVNMQGGTLSILIDEDYRASMSGQVEKICDIDLAPEFIEALLAG